MRTDTADRILSYIRTNKQAKAIDLVRNIGITNSAIHRQLNKMLKQEKIIKAGKPPLVFYLINENKEPSLVPASSGIKKYPHEKYAKPTNLTRVQELELLSALDTRAESPVKFAYVGSGYKDWTEIAEKSRKEHSVQAEENTLRTDSLPFIFRKVTTAENVNLIDFGCGDGAPMSPTIDYLKDVSNLSYIPVDISQNMLSVATKNIRKKFPTLKIKKILCDFEKGDILEKILPLTKSPNTQNYFFLLGNTLGNFENTKEILSNLKLTMFSDDCLIIGNEIANLFAAAEFVEYYKAKEVFNLVSSTLKDYGDNCSYDEYAVRWNSKEKQIEMFLTLKKARDIKIADYTVHFNKGEEILLAISKKFAEETIVELFNNVGFRIDLFATNQKKNNCLASVTPTRYKS